MCARIGAVAESASGYWQSLRRPRGAPGCRSCGSRPVSIMRTRSGSIDGLDSSNARRSVITSRTRSVYSCKSGYACRRVGGGMPGNLTFPDLKKAVSAGTIDTVIVAMVDMQGRLVGKRFQAEYFVGGAHEETHGCNHLLANDIDMEPVPGYAAASWDKGYGDFVMKPDMATLRHVPWLEGTALVLCDVLDHHHHELPHSPRAM